LTPLITGDIADGLIDAHVKQGGGLTRASTINGTLNPSETESGKTEIAIHPISVRAPERRLRQTFIHEGMHTTPQEIALKEQFLNNPGKFNRDHLNPYNSKAYKLK